MAASLAGEGFGTVFGRGTTATTITSDTFTAIAEIQKISVDGMNGASIDVSNMDSPNGWREFIPGLVDGGTVKIEMNLIPAEVTKLIADFRAKKNYRFVLPTGISTVTNNGFYFSGFLESHSLDVPFDSQVTQNATFKITGKPTYVP